MCKKEEFDEVTGESFFQNYLNHSKIHKTECAPTAMGPWMSQADTKNGFIFQNGNLDLASFDENGVPALDKDAKFPFDLEFVPDRQTLIPTDSSSRFYKQLVQNSLSIQPGDRLFTVMGRAINDDGTLSNFEEIGEIV